MKPLKSMKCNLLLICFFVFFSIIMIDEAVAANYYVCDTAADCNAGDGSGWSTGNDGNNCTAKSTPCKTFSGVEGKAEFGKGDTLTIGDGIYTGSDAMIAVTKSGTDGNPITIQAENDGKVTINGESKRYPCVINGEASRIHDVTIEGIICQNSNNDAVEVKYADRITLKRISGYNAGPKNHHVFSLSNVTDSLLEDTVASGSGRVLYDIISSDYITVRRCYGRWQSHAAPNMEYGPYAFMQIYNTDDSIVENCVGTKDSKHVQGLKLWTSGSKGGDRNKVYGNVMYDFDSSVGFMLIAKYRAVSGNEFLNNVGINNKYGFRQGGDDNLTSNKNTIVNSSDFLYSVDNYNYEPKNGDYEVGGVLKNSVLMSSPKGLSVSDNGYLGTFTNSYNAFWDITGTFTNENYYRNFASQGLGDINADPMYKIETYGRGAYLIIPSNLKNEGCKVNTEPCPNDEREDIGAEVLYRYHDRKLTNVPLWPWPMENRICAETGFSVTYEDGCSKGGGLWKTLDSVYSEQSQNSDETDYVQDGFIEMDADDGTSGSNTNETSSSSSSDNYKYIISVDPEGTFVNAENYTNTISAMGISAFLPENNLNDYFGTGYLTTSGPDAKLCSDAKEGKEYLVNFKDTGKYNIWIRGYATDASSDSVFVGVDGVCVGSVYSSGNWNYWDWMNSGSGNAINVTKTGTHTINIWLREPNFHIDGIYLTQGTETPPGDLAYLDNIPPAPPLGLVIH